MYKNFEQWFDIFLDEVRTLNYRGLVDRETFEIDFENGKDPVESAAEFVEEMNS